jgi:hypothetical protein
MPRRTEQERWTRRLGAQGYGSQIKNHIGAELHRDCGVAVFAVKAIRHKKVFSKKVTSITIDVSRVGLDLRQCHFS